MNDWSLITCPHCGTSKLEEMPADACQFFYDCSGCGARLKPKPGNKRLTLLAAIFCRSSKNI
jgi:DNA-directed RNA polymerase subunit RPC12/RpoP